MMLTLSVVLLTDAEKSLIIADELKGSNHTRNY